MQMMNVPRLDMRYWTTLALASVFGTNTGDIISHTMHLGNYAGLPWLAAAFAAILLAERRARVATTLYYWLAIIVLRTAATNIADLGTLQWEFDYETLIAGSGFLLALAVVLALVLRRSGFLSSGPAVVSGQAGAGIASTDGVYWFAMLTAATLGTALGDFGAHTMTLRVSVFVTVGLLAAVFGLVRRSNSDTALYWVTIVLARAAGTNVGDLIAFKKG